MSEIPGELSEEEYVQTMDQADREEALYDAREYLIAGLPNQAEWWEHLGDAHRDYAALARAVESIGLLDDAGRLHRMVEVVTERDHYRAALQDIASREWRDEGGRIAAAITRDALGVKSNA